MERLPELTEDLLKELEKLIPNRCPSRDMTDRDIWWEAGRRSVVDYLLSLKNNPMKRRRLLPENSEPPEED
jgi:hypothetical protein